MRAKPRLAVPIDVEQVPRGLRKMIEVLLRAARPCRMRLTLSRKNETRDVGQGARWFFPEIRDVEHRGLAFTQDDSVGARTKVHRGIVCCVRAIDRHPATTFRSESDHRKRRLAARGRAHLREEV